MNKIVQLACERRIKVIKLTDILPMRQVASGTKSTLKYRQITASMREVGLIEPLVVYPQKEMVGKFMLLDGHVRLDVLREAGVTTVKCLVATDDEGFTYNHKVSRLTVIQEHFMIMKAVKNGVSEKAIADALSIDVSAIRKKRDLLVGICSEAVELLRGKVASTGTFGQLRKVLPMRQIEMAELMIASHNFSVDYACCLVAATSADQLLEKDDPRDTNGLSPIEMARMEREMESLSKDFKQMEEVHGKNVLNLVIVAGYLKKLLDNARVVRYLASAYPEILTEFQKVVETRQLGNAEQ